MTEKSYKSKKLELVPKPNEQFYRDRIQAETTAIEELKAKINELQQRITVVIGGREGYNMEKAQRQSRLDTFQKQIDELEDKRKVLFDQIQYKQKEGAEMKQSASDLRRKIGFSTAEEIDKKIAALEHSMMTSTLSLKEEKQLLESIKRLKNSKPLLTKYQGLEQSASSLEDSSVIPLRAMLDEVRTKLLELRTMKREESLKYKELLEKRQKSTAPGRELIEERDRLSKEMNKHFMNRREVHAEFSSEMQKHQAYMLQVKRERGTKLREEREKRNLENERLQLERELERVECELPYEAESLLLTQTIQYLQKIIDEPSSNSAKDKANEYNASNLAGALLPKSQREEVFFFAPKHKNKQSHKEHEKKEKPKVLKYDVGTLGYFEQCGVTAPVSVDDIPACLDKLEAKLQTYKALQQESSLQVDNRKAEIMAKMHALNERVASHKKEQMARSNGKDPRPASAEVADGVSGEDECLDG